MVWILMELNGRSNLHNFLNAHLPLVDGYTISALSVQDP